MAEIVAPASEARIGATLRLAAEVLLEEAVEDLPFWPMRGAVLGSNRLRSLMVNDLGASRPSFDVGCSRYPRFPAV